MQKKELVWSDEFDYNGLPDSTKWNYNVGGHGWGNNELQYYTKERAENARVEDGNLIIESRYEMMENMEYTSARLTSRNKGDWKYGRVEVRAILPSGTGVWPAIWMLPTEWKYGGWPESGEIDIMEYVGFKPDTIHGTIHTEAYNHTKNTQKGSNIRIPTAEEEYHIYILEWQEDKIDILVDDQSYFTFMKESDDPAVWPFNQDFHIVLNIAVGGNWGGQKGVDTTIFPQQMVVDYVRVYQ
ncbi:MAG: glycoside hydrolase family 16 protein [Bacteroidales bacterium]|nr:MAG: glycoside hydrolase family 16 protein [Bacteroidales bacterium]